MGDGWGNAQLFVVKQFDAEASSRSAETYSVLGFQNPQKIEICAEGNVPETVTLSVTSVKKDEAVEASWEIVWLVSSRISDGDSSTSVGIFDSSMTYQYSPLSDNWSLLSGDKLMDSTFECPAKIGALATSCASDMTVFQQPLTNQDPASSTQVTGPSPVKFPLQLFDSVSRSWFRPNGLGSAWYITDDSRTHVLALGSKMSVTPMEHYEVPLHDGSYYLRVTGALDDGAGTHYWEFCGTAGSTGDELSFYVTDGRCFAADHFTAQMLGSGRIRTTLTLEGTITLERVSDTDMITSVELGLAKQSLLTGVSSYLLEGNTQLTVAGNNGNVGSSIEFSDARRLSGDMKLDVLAKLVLEDMGYDGTNKHTVKLFSDSVISDIREFVSSGSYASLLKETALDRGNSFLLSVHSAVLDSLDVEGVTYNVEQDEASNDASTDQLEDKTASLEEAPKIAEMVEHNVTKHARSYTLGTVLLVGITIGVLMTLIAWSYQAGMRRLKRRALTELDLKELHEKSRSIDDDERSVSIVSGIDEDNVSTLDDTSNSKHVLINHLHALPPMYLAANARAIGKRHGKSIPMPPAAMALLKDIESLSVTSSITMSSHSSVTI